MSNVCCKELKGWCKSFTRTETYLSLLQVVFLVVFIASLTFIVLHFLACSNYNKDIAQIKEINKTSTPKINITTSKIIEIDNISTLSTFITEDQQNSSELSSETHIASKQTPLPKEIECTWTPSQKTKAVTHYYYKDVIVTTKKQKTETAFQDNIEKLYNGEYADDVKKGFLLALVKMKPPQDITFGCTLTIVAPTWTLTAASCIEAIEEVDSLDSFVMLRGFGERNEGSIHATSDILIHPQYQGVNKTYDLAALKAEDRIVNEINEIVKLPTIVDYLLITIGQRLSILGYGKFRNVDADPQSRSVREVSVYRLPGAQCPEEAGAWAPRHLGGGRGVERARGGAGALCAGALRGRAQPCRYCAGAPLLRGRLLLGLMSDSPHCGLACDPALYVNLALVRDWLDSVIYSD